MRGSKVLAVVARGTAARVRGLHHGRAKGLGVRVIGGGWRMLLAWIAVSRRLAEWLRGCLAVERILLRIEGLLRLGLRERRAIGSAVRMRGIRVRLTLRGHGVGVVGPRRVGRRGWAEGRHHRVVGHRGHWSRLGHHVVARWVSELLLLRIVHLRGKRVGHGKKGGAARELVIVVIASLGFLLTRRRRRLRRRFHKILEYPRASLLISSFTLLTRRLRSASARALIL